MSDKLKRLILSTVFFNLYFLHFTGNFLISLTLSEKI